MVHPLCLPPPPSLAPRRRGEGGGARANNPSFFINHSRVYTPGIPASARASPSFLLLPFSLSFIFPCKYHLRGVGWWRAKGRSIKQGHRCRLVSTFSRDKTILHFLRSTLPFQAVRLHCDRTEREATRVRGCVWVKREREREEKNPMGVKFSTSGG